MEKLIVVVVLLCTLQRGANSETQLRPNIVFIVADDLGWNDASFHGSDQILTPNIDVLAATGISLHRYYSHGVCTPSRAALMTGKYAHRTGMHGYPLTNAEDRGLPMTEKILPQYLKELGYSTHHVGKWHLGHSRYKYLPTFRGYDTSYGHRGGFMDYYEYTAEETWVTGKVSGLTLFRNVTPDWGAEGYVTDLYTDEARDIINSHKASSSPLFLMVEHNAPHAGNDGALLQAPHEEVRAMRHVESPQRRIYAAMVKKLDDSVGDIIEALNKKDILNNTIVVFIADNGAPTVGLSMNYGSNWPLRGVKMTPWEGGTRLVGLVWSMNMNKSHNLWKGYMHATDWLPTILAAIDADPPNVDIDGINLWNNILNNDESARNEIYEINTDYPKGYCGVISGNYKLVSGNLTREISNEFGESLRGVIGHTPSYIDTVNTCKTYEILSAAGKIIDGINFDIRQESKITCDHKKIEKCIPGKDQWCLYNIANDPCEEKNLAKLMPDLVTKLLNKLQSALNKETKRKPLFRDPRGAPKLYNYTWVSFMDVAPFTSGS